jgi:hypothetical protein
VTSLFVQGALTGAFAADASSAAVRAAGIPFWPVPKLPNPNTEWSARVLLADLGCHQEFMAALTRVFFHPITFIVIVIGLTAAAVVGYVKERGHRLNLGAGVLAFSVLLAVFQWHASLEQDAMQRYESEAAGANGAETKEVAKMLPDLYPVSEEPARSQAHFVYISLDNLEYAIERYREGFASATTTVRAVMTFAVHCREPQFKRLVKQQLVGYSPVVQRVANAIIALTE